MNFDIEYRILNLYKTRQYDLCLSLCNDVLKTQSDRMIEFVRMRAMAIQAKIAGNGYEEVNYCPQQNKLTATAIAKTPRPGTSFQRTAKTAQNFTTELKSSKSTLIPSGTARMPVRTARTALNVASQASRAATAVANGTNYDNAPVTLRFLSKDDKMFIPAAKTLFEYIYYCESNVRKAMDVAFQAIQVNETNDWWWNFSLARCYESLGMYRNVEEYLRQALKQNKHVSIFLRFIGMYVGLNQPLTALEICKQGLTVYHADISLLLEQARIYQQINNNAVAVKYYRIIASENPSNMEAIANIALYNFYNDQPEIALRYYRRLLATNPPSAEIYNNLGLCCLYCNQWDITLPCFRQALFFATSPKSRSSIWFNLAHVALSTGDMTLARRCLLASSAISEHEPARHALRSLDRRMNARPTIKT